MRLILFTCCDRAIIDQRTNVLSLIGCIESYSSPSFPIAIPSLSLVAWIEREQDEPDVIEFKSFWYLDGAKIGEVPVLLRFQNSSKSRALVEVTGIVIEKPGTLEIRLRHNRKRLGIWRIEVNQIGKPHAVDNDEDSRRPRIKDQSARNR